jgi:hypothetical protein
VGEGGDVNNHTTELSIDEVGDDALGWHFIGKPAVR